MEQSGRKHRQLSAKPRAAKAAPSLATRRLQLHPVRTTRDGKEGVDLEPDLDVVRCKFADRPPSLPSLFAPIVASIERIIAACGSFRRER